MGKRYENIKFPINIVAAPSLEGRLGRVMLCFVNKLSFSIMNGVKCIPRPRILYVSGTRPLGTCL